MAKHRILESDLYQFKKVSYQGGEPQTVQIVRQGETTKLYPFKKIIYKQAACRSDSRIRHLFAEQGSHIALALRPNVGFKNPTYADDAAELLLFCKVIFWIGITQMVRSNCFYFVRLFFRMNINKAV